MYAALLILLAQAPPDHGDDRYPDLPRLCEAREFGVTQPYARQQWERHRLHVEYLDRSRHRYYVSITQDGWDSWRHEACWRRDAWDTLDDALNPKVFGEKCSRERLMKLRWLLGDVRYERRWMPAPYPPLMYHEE